MESIVILILHLLLYGIPPLVIVKLVKINKSMTYFYAYLEGDHTKGSNFILILPL